MASFPVRCLLFGSALIVKSYGQTISTTDSSLKRPVLRLIMPLNTVNALTNRETYGKLLRARFGNGDYNVDDVEDATQMVFNLTDHLTAVCHVQFHTVFRTVNGTTEDTSAVLYQNDYIVPNGFIHIAPPTMRLNRTLLEIIRSTRQLSKYYKAIHVVPGLPEYLACNRQITVFAPNNEAIDKFGSDKFKILMQWPSAMQELLSNLVVSNGSYLTSDWADNDTLATLNIYGSLLIRITNDRILRVLNTRQSPFVSSEANSVKAPSVLPGRAKEDQALVLESDYTGQNGVLHIVDSILYPPVPSVNETVAQLFPFSPYMPLPPIDVSSFDGSCMQRTAGLVETETATFLPLPVRSTATTTAESTVSTIPRRKMHRTRNRKRT
ncbi:uncharacterized protein LOC129594292 [Paramacrobiotus metropolitanus]|uniref:uncharacterized protein LOC129594292 n=1 Tax=Paramacrobiotus metropolitanus TaxID=2943436 RepID=UPI002446431E|nr:uncharacterized protein LOC129594292 [Paramacrobiotus metropolitanus]